MVLAVDIGNTNIVMGCFDGTELKFRERISTNQLATDLEYAATIKMALDMHGIGPSQLKGVIVSSVVTFRKQHFQKGNRKAYRA